jgi:hypothetical protein
VQCRIALDAELLPQQFSMPIANDVVVLLPPVTMRTEPSSAVHRSAIKRVVSVGQLSVQINRCAAKAVDSSQAHLLTASLPESPLVKVFVRHFRSFLPLSIRLN